MPSMANITVKKADGTTDIIFTSLSPSAGDTVPAKWRQNDASIPAQRPVITMRTQDNGPRTARKEVLTGKFPYVDADGVVQGTIPWSFETTVPTSIPDSFVAEVVHQSTNFIASSLIRTSLQDGQAPT